MATVSCRECGALIINEASNVPFDQRGECPVMDMHRYSGETERLAQAVMRIALDRLRMDAPLDGPRSAADLTARAGQTITAEGLGGNEALRLWTDVLGPATMSVDHPRYLALIPGAPTESSTLFDLIVSASSVRAGGWLESSGAVYAENQALRWVCDLVGLPRARAAASCRAEPSATCRPWWRPAMPRSSGAAASGRRAGRWRSPTRRTAPSSTR